MRSSKRANATRLRKPGRASAASCPGCKSARSKGLRRRINRSFCASCAGRQKRLDSHKSKKFMFAVYRISADELDAQFLESLKKTFAHKEIEITVNEADETDYLLRSPPNRERLLRAVQDIEQNRNIIVPGQQTCQ